MGQVIEVDFSKKTPIDDGLSEYLDYLRGLGLDEDDVLDVQDAIRDKDKFLEADDVIQKFATAWFDQFK
jgi:hypothetical protein